MAGKTPGKIKHIQDRNDFKSGVAMRKFFSRINVEKKKIDLKRLFAVLSVLMIIAFGGKAVETVAAKAAPVDDYHSQDQPLKTETHDIERAHQAALCTIFGTS